MKRLAFAVVLSAPVLAQAPALTHGPLRGHVDGTALHAWARAATSGRYQLHLRRIGAATTTAVEALAEPARDLTLHFVVAGLEPAAAYEVWISSGDTVLTPRTTWTTAIADDASAAVIAFGSCSNERTFPEQPIWGRILARAPHALVLLGDTPYIDSGAIAVRQRRHREFFAFAPVAATLAAIPTWTTWDDHDYAANDQFGAVAAAATARAVFVDYHAHAGYGDGTDGIWTSFRRGPIEVFVLDTRSFADRGDSVLAPGQRTLLGQQQIEWLQRGLRASSAPVKVLACGMVWNDGVRPSKRDCWGNWQPERDALFAWLGAQDVDGVVLVSGDVHRSRVILHPTRALLGYDLPEFVTSPLAQNVLESNAVPTAGLVFDAGEAHSCLFLDAVRTDQGPVLRAVFQAGDGREFHRREFAPGALARSDAAVGYRAIAAALRHRFGRDVVLPDTDGAPDVLGMTAAEAVRDDWRKVVAAAEPELVAFAAVVDQPHCRFRPTSDDPLMPEFVRELLLPVRGLQALNVAAALQAIEDRDPARLERACRCALGLARHLQQEPGMIAWAVASQLEAQAIELLASAAPVGGDVVARLRAVLDAHVAKRPGFGAAAAAMRIEIERLFAGSLEQLQLGKDAKARVARQFGAAVRQQFFAELAPILDAFAALPDEPDPAREAALQQMVDGLVQRRQERMRQIQALAAEGGDARLGESAARDLATMLAAMLLPPLRAFRQEQLETLARLRAATQDRPPFQSPR